MSERGKRATAAKGEQETARDDMVGPDDDSLFGARTPSSAIKRTSPSSKYDSFSSKYLPSPKKLPFFKTTHFSLKLKVS